jgi:ribose-phosphate pyrophosphokinase
MGHSSAYRLRKINLKREKAVPHDDKVLLLADPCSNAWEFADQMQAHIYKEKRVHWDLNPVEIFKFANGELDIHAPHNLRRREVYYIADSSKDPQDWVVELERVANMLLLSSAERINFVLPDMKYNRQDRKHKPRVSIGAIDLAKHLKPYWPVVREIFTMDLHAKQIEGFFFPIPLENIPSTPALAQFLRSEKGIPNLEEIVLVAADKGDFDRVEDLNNYLRLKNPPAYIYKQRDPETRKITKLELVGNVEGKRVLVPDDLIDKGTTLCRASALLRQEGAREIIAYGTHGWFTKGEEIVTSCFDRVIVSNTHNKQYGEKIEVIDVAPIFAEAVYRSQMGQSLSELWSKSV